MILNDWSNSSKTRMKRRNTNWRMLAWRWDQYTRQIFVLYGLPLFYGPSCCGLFLPSPCRYTTVKYKSPYHWLIQLNELTVDNLLASAVCTSSCCNWVLCVNKMTTSKLMVHSTVPRWCEQCLRCFSKDSKDAMMDSWKRVCFYEKWKVTCMFTDEVASDGCW